jgi:hypothetical protein
MGQGKGWKRVITEKTAKKMVRWERKKEGTQEDRAWEGRLITDGEEKE